MQLFRTLLLIFILSLIGLPIFAQTGVMANSINYDHYKEFCAILHEGVPIVKRWDGADELVMTPDMRGTLTVSTVNRKAGKFDPEQPIGFKLAIKNHRTNALWMYSEEIFYEIEIEEILKKCEMGDQLIFITIDRKHQLPRHELRINMGC